VIVEVTVLPSEGVDPTVAIPPTVEVVEEPVYWIYQAALNPVTFKTTWTASSDSIIGTMPNGQPYELNLRCNSWTLDFGELFPNGSTRYVDVGERYFAMDEDSEVTDYSESIEYGWLPLGTQLAIFDTAFNGDFIEELIGDRFNNPNYNAMALSISSPITGSPLVGWWRTDDFQAVYDSMHENCPRTDILPTPTAVLPSPTPAPMPTPMPTPTPTPTPADIEAIANQAILDNMPPWATSWLYTDRGEVVYVGPGELSVGLSRTVATSVVLDMPGGAICANERQTIVCEFPGRPPLTLHFGPDGLTHWEDGAPSY